MEKKPLQKKERKKDYPRAGSAFKSGTDLSWKPGSHRALVF